MPCLRASSCAASSSVCACCSDLRIRHPFLRRVGRGIGRFLLRDLMVDLRLAVVAVSLNDLARYGAGICGHVDRLQHLVVQLDV